MYYNQLTSITFENLKEFNEFVKNNKHMKVAYVYTDIRKDSEKLYCTFIDTRKF